MTVSYSSRFRGKAWLPAGVVPNISKGEASKWCVLYVGFHHPTKGGQLVLAGADGNRSQAGLPMERIRRGEAKTLPGRQPDYPRLLVGPAAEWSAIT